MEWLLYDMDLHHERIKWIIELLNYWISEAYLEPSQTSKMELFAKIVNGV